MGGEAMMARPGPLGGVFAMVAEALAAGKLTWRRPRAAGLGSTIAETDKTPAASRADRAGA